MRRLLSFALIALSVALAAAILPAAAQTDTGEIDISVQEAAAKTPVALARVLLDGPVIASEFTGANGKVHFTEVPDGIYRARVFARGFQAVTSAQFEVTNGRLVTVTVSLALAADHLKTIAVVVAKSTANVSTTSIDQNSAQRRLSDTLADALGKLSGVTVSTASNDSDATQTVSLEGQDASQTALTLDGIPLNAPGSAGDLNAIGTDLFTRSSVSFGPQAGGLAGGVNFSTLQPTISWQSEFSLSAGSNGKNDYSLGESGSIGKLGIAAMHTYRLTPSLLDGMDFEDASGLDYSHDGDRQQMGSMLNLRYGTGGSQTFSAMLMHTVNGSQLVCAQQTGALPCGYGPGNSYNTGFDLYSLTDDALVGNTQVAASFFGMNTNSSHDLLDRYVDGIASPTGTVSAMRNSGFTLNAILPAQQRHTISISAYQTQSQSSFTPLVPEAQPYVFPGQNASYGTLTVNDAIRSNTKLRFNDSIGLSHASNAPGSVLLGVGAQWQPTTADTLAASYNVGGSGAHAGRFGVLTDPASLRFDCTGDVAYGSAPGDQPGASSSSSARLSYTHKTRAGLLSASLYRQVQNGLVLPTQVNGTAIAGSTFPPFYFAQAAADFDAACGQALPFGAADTYFSTPVGGVRRVYQGAQLSAFYTLGRLVVEPYYDLQQAQAISGDPRLNNPYAITISGAQLPNVPLHRGGITLDYKAPGSLLEWLADANYTGSNNSQNLPAYATVDAGVDVHLQRGDLVFAGSNLFNAYGGIFAGPQWAVPYRTLGGLAIATIARPNTPRQFSVTYTVRTGSAPASSGRALLGQAGQERRRGFGRFFSPLPQSPPADPFALRDSPACTSAAKVAAQPVLSALRSYVASIEAAKHGSEYPASMPAPQIPGVQMTYQRIGTTYALTISLEQTALLRPIFGCSQFHVADEQTAAQRHLFVQSQPGGMFMRPSISFMPAVGLYFVRRPPQPGTENFRMYRMPASAPQAPFALVGGPACTSAQRTQAAPALAQLAAHFSAGGATPAWTITAHTASGGAWYELSANDIATVPAIIGCGRVAAVSADDLKQVGLSAVLPPELNYAPRLGLYLMRGPRPAPPPSH